MYFIKDISPREVIYFHGVITHMETLSYSYLLIQGSYPWERDRGQGSGVTLEYVSPSQDGHTHTGLVCVFLFLLMLLTSLPLFSAPPPPEATDASGAHLRPGTMGRCGPQFAMQHMPDYRQNVYIPGSTATLLAASPQPALPPPQDQAPPPIQAEPPKPAQTPASKKKSAKKDKK